jgi:hypothetical protein
MTMNCRAATGFREGQRFGAYFVVILPARDPEKWAPGFG